MQVSEYLKMFGVNGSTLAVVSLTELELFLKVVVLLLTALWTSVKIWKLVKGDE